MGRKTNKQRRAAQGASAREKAAAARAIQQRADQRQRAMKIISTVVVVAIVIVVGVVVAITRPGKANDASGDRQAAPASLVKSVTSVTPAELDKVATTSLAVKATKGDAALTVDGKPDVLFIGGEFCPFCAAERWAVLQGLSRFGTFKNVSVIHSASDDGDIATFSFYKSTYTSKYLAFTPVEAEDRDSKPLETPTKAQLALWNKYGGSFPFIDFGGKYYQTGAAYSDTDLSGLTQTQIAAQLKDPTSQIGKDILGEANNITAEVCTLTKNQPANVCLSPTITIVQSQLNALSA